MAIKPAEIDNNLYLRTTSNKAMTFNQSGYYYSTYNYSTYKNQGYELAGITCWSGNSLYPLCVYDVDEGQAAFSIKTLANNLTSGLTISAKVILFFIKTS